MGYQLHEITLTESLVDFESRELHSIFAQDALGGARTILYLEVLTKIHESRRR